MRDQLRDAALEREEGEAQRARLQRERDEAHAKLATLAEERRALERALAASGSGADKTRARSPAASMRAPSPAPEAKDVGAGADGAAAGGADGGRPGRSWLLTESVLEEARAAVATASAGVQTDSSAAPAVDPRPPGPARVRPGRAVQPVREARHAVLISSRCAGVPLLAAAVRNRHCLVLPYDARRESAMGLVAALKGAMSHARVKALASVAIVCRCATQGGVAGDGGVMSVVDAVPFTLEALAGVPEAGRFWKALGACVQESQRGGGGSGSLPAPLAGPAGDASGVRIFNCAPDGVDGAWAALPQGAKLLDAIAARAGCGVSAAALGTSGRSDAAAPDPIDGTAGSARDEYFDAAGLDRWLAAHTRGARARSATTVDRAASTPELVPSAPAAPASADDSSASVSESLAGFRIALDEVRSLCACALRAVREDDAAPLGAREQAEVELAVASASSAAMEALGACRRTAAAAAHRCARDGSVGGDGGDGAGSGPGRLPHRARARLAAYVSQVGGSVRGSLSAFEARLDESSEGLDLSRTGLERALAPARELLASARASADAMAAAVGEILYGSGDARAALDVALEDIGSVLGRAEHALCASLRGALADGEVDAAEATQLQETLGDAEERVSYALHALGPSLVNCARASTSGRGDGGGGAAATGAAEAHALVARVGDDIEAKLMDVGASVQAIIGATLPTEASRLRPLVRRLLNTVFRWQFILGAGAEARVAAHARGPTAGVVAAAEAAASCGAKAMLTAARGVAAFVRLGATPGGAMPLASAGPQQRASECAGLREDIDRAADTVARMLAAARLSALEALGAHRAGERAPLARAEADALREVLRDAAEALTDALDDAEELVLDAIARAEPTWRDALSAGAGAALRAASARLRKDLADLAAGALGCVRARAGDAGAADDEAARSALRAARDAVASDALTHLLYGVPIDADERGLGAASEPNTPRV